MTYLGLDSAHHLGDAAAHATTTTVIRAGSTALQHRIASPACKLDVTLMQLFPKVLYPAAKTCWSLRDYQQLDTALAPPLKHTSRYIFFPAHMAVQATTSSVILRKRANGGNYDVLSQRLAKQP